MDEAGLDAATALAALPAVPAGDAAADHELDTMNLSLDDLDNLFAAHQAIYQG